MMRAFIAVEIDLPNKQKISGLISDLKKSDADVKWVNESQMHLTLKFLGNIEENRVCDISDVLENISKDFRTFSLCLSDIGAFPNIRKPRVIWISIDKGYEELKLLADKVETGLVKLGFEKEKREFKPHLTLGRVKSLKNSGNMESLVGKINFQPAGEIKIDKIILFQSTLMPKGAIYAPISRFNLARAAKLT